MQTQARAGHPALQNGLLFGIILGFIEAVLSFLTAGVGLIISLIIYLGLTGLAGYRASARTGKVSTGLVAGLLAGLFSSVIASTALFISYLPNIDKLRQLMQQQANTFNQGFTINYTNNVVIAALVLFLVIVILGSSLLALGIGAIGGAMGKGKAPVQAAPPYPYPGQYQYPDPRYMPPPVYPPQEYKPPQAYPPPQSYPPSPQEYMSPPPPEK